MPEHLDFLRRALTWHSLTCEASLLSDNLARLLGVPPPESMTLVHRLLETLQCTL